MEPHDPGSPGEPARFEVGGNVFYNCDCILGAREFVAENSVDLVICDPPYGIRGDKLHRHYNRSEEFVVDGYVEVAEPDYGEFSARWIREAERILRPGGSIYIVSGYTNLYHVLHALRETRLEEVNHVIWKYNFGVFTRQKYVSSHYHVLFYQKPGGRRTFNLEARYGLGERAEGGGSLNYRDREDVWTINREYKPGREKNKNELPTALLAKMIQYSSDEGETVCDLFLGGFSTAITAIGLNRRAIGFEVSPRIFERRTREISALIPGFLLPGARRPVRGPAGRRGQAWTADETERLLREYGRLRAQGWGKGAAVEHGK